MTRRLIFAIAIFVAALIGPVTPASASHGDQFPAYGDLTETRDTSMGTFVASMRSGNVSLNHCQVYLYNTTSILRKYGAYLWNRDLNDWLYFSGSQIVYPGNFYSWEVPGITLEHEDEPYIKISAYYWNGSSWSLSANSPIVLDPYNHINGEVDQTFPWGSQSWPGC